MKSSSKPAKAAGAKSDAKSPAATHGAPKLPKGKPLMTVQLDVYKAKKGGGHIGHLHSAKTPSSKKK